MLETQSTVTDQELSTPLVSASSSEDAEGRWPRLRHRGLDFVERRPVLSVFLVALVVRVMLAVGIMVFAGGALFPDASGYNTIASDVAAGETANWEEGTEWFYNQNATLLLPLTFVYWIFGPRLLAGLILVAFFGSLAAAGVARLALEVLQPRWAVLGGMAVALFPSQVLWSAVLLKDAASWAALVGLAVWVAKAGGAQGWALARAAIGVVFFLVLVVHLRVHTFIVASWAVALAAWFGRPAYRLVRGAGALAIALLLPWAFGAGLGGYTFVKNGAEHTEFIRTAMAYGAATAFVPQKAAAPPQTAELQEEIALIEEQGARLREALAELEQEAEGGQGSAVEQQIKESRERLAELEERKVAAMAELAEQAPPATEQEASVRRDLAHLPKGYSVMLLEPFPWRNYDNPKVQLVRLEMLLWYPLLILALVGLTQAWRYRRVLAFPILSGAGIATMYALIEGNFGTAYRHRGELVWVVLTLAAVGGYTAFERMRARSGTTV